MPVQLSRRQQSEMPCWLQGGSIVAAEIAARDWSRTSLGPLEEWPAALRTTLNLILNSDQPIFVGWDQDLLCFYNDAYLPLLDVEEDALGRPLREVFPEALNQVAPLFSKALQGEVTYRGNVAIPIRRADKLRDSRWTLSFTPIRDSDGDVCGVFVPVYEVTDRVKAEEHFEARQESLEIFANLAPGMLWRADTDGAITWINRRFKDYLGGSDPMEAIHPQDRPSVEDIWQQVRQKKTRFHHYLRLKDANDHYRWHLAISEPRIGNDGAVFEWYGVATDVHDLYSAADALSESASLFRSFASNSSDVLWIADVKSQCMDYVSTAFHGIWGPASKDKITWDYRLSTVHPDDRARQAQSFDQLLDGRVLHEHYRIIRSDGGVRWIRETMFPILNADGVIHKIGGIAQDITRQNGRIVHLIDGGPESRNLVGQRLQAIGYQVRPFATVDAFVKVSGALLPGCVVLLDPDGGKEAERLAPALKDSLAALPLVLVTNVQDPGKVIGLMKAGVNDILLPDDPPERLGEAVATALSEMLTGFREHDFVRQAKEAMQKLTDREREILAGLSEGATNKMLARTLDVSPRTVETYRVRILEKLGVSALPQAVKIHTLAGL